jgi:SAM-dependent methyltransferase
MISALRAGAYSQVTGIVADARRLPFLSGHFDAVVFAFSLHLFEEPLSALSEAARVLKPGGRIAVLCPLLEDLQKQLFHKYMPHFHRHDAPRTLTLQKLQAWVEQVGLRNGPLLREDFEIPFGTPDEFVEFVQHKPFFGLQQITEEEFQADIAHLKSELARHPSGVPVVTQGTLTTVVYDKRKEKLG